MQLQRVAAALAGMIVGGLSLVACTSTQPSAGSGTSTSTTEAPTTTTSTSVVPSSSTIATTTTSAPVAGEPCTHAAIRLASGPTSGAAGTIYLGFTISNVGPVSCLLDGYATLVLNGPSGTVTPVVSHSGQGAVFGVPATQVTLPANGAASAAFAVSYSDVSQGGQTSCPAVTSITFTLPGPSGRFTLAKSFSPCGPPTLSVSAIMTEAQFRANFH